MLKIYLIGCFGGDGIAAAPRPVKVAQAAYRSPGRSVKEGHSTSFFILYAAQAGG